MRAYVLGGLAVVVGLACCAVGVSGMIETAHYGTGEFEGLTVIFVNVVDAAGALIVFVLSRFIRVKGLRRVCVALAILSAVLPFVMYANNRHLF